MASRDVVAVIATLVHEGLKALVPGSGVAVSAAAKVLQPDLDRARTWLQDRREQQDFADAVEAWARRNEISEADVDLGMSAAASILRQSGAGADDLVGLDLDAVRIADRVLGGDPIAQRNLPPGAQEVCSNAVTMFYERLLTATGPDEVTRAALKELLRRSTALDEMVVELGRHVADAKKSAAGKKDPRRRLLEQTINRISQLESAQSEFRWVTGPESGGSPTPEAVGDARRRLVAARVGLEATATQLDDHAVRDAVLAFVLADEKEDRALRRGTSNKAEFEAIRDATIDAYKAALDAVATPMRDRRRSGSARGPEGSTATAT